MTPGNRGLVVLLAGMGEGGACAVERLGGRRYRGVHFFPFTFLQPPYHVPDSEPFGQWATADSRLPAPDLALALGSGHPGEETLVRELAEALKPRGTLVICIQAGPASPQETAERLARMKESAWGADAVFLAPRDLVGREEKLLERAAGPLLEALLVPGAASFDFNDYRVLARGGLVGVALSLEAPADAAGSMAGRMLGHPIWKALPERCSRWLVCCTGPDPLNAPLGLMEEQARQGARVKLVSFPAKDGEPSRLALFAGYPCR